MDGIVCHTVTMLDSYGDGWSDGSGSHFWVLYDADGNAEQTGSDFTDGSSMTEEMCILNNTCYNFVIEGDGIYGSEVSQSIEKRHAWLSPAVRKLPRS